MRKYILIFFCLIFLLVPVYADVLNGGFESTQGPLNSTTPYWSNLNSQTRFFSIGYLATCVHSGSYGAAIAGDGSNNGGIYQSISSGESAVKYYVKHYTSGATGAGISSCFVSYAPPNDSNWHLVSVNITGGGYLYICSDSTAGDAVYIDDISLVPGPITPVANFTAWPLSGTNPVSVSFTDTSTNVPTSWSWDFGDGNFTSNTTQNPNHLYSTAGVYNVTLTATNSAGYSTLSKINYITVNPYVLYTTDVYINRFDNHNPISGTFTYFLSGGGFSAGGTTDQYGHKTTLLILGNYSYTVGATGYNTQTGNVSINGASTQQYYLNVASNNTNSCQYMTASVNRGNAPLSVTFTDISPTVNQAISSLWDYGDGMGQNANGQHTYISPEGIFTVAVHEFDITGHDTKYSCPGIVQTYLNNTTNPITPTPIPSWSPPSPYPITTIPTSIPVTTPITGKNTVYYRVKNSSSYNMPSVSIQQWEYQYDITDIFHLFGKHAVQIDGGFTDSNGNFMSALDSNQNYDYKIGGNINQSNTKTYTSSTGSFVLNSDKYINATSDLYGLNTTLYVFDIYIYDLQQYTLRLPNVQVKLYLNNNEYAYGGTTDINGHVIILGNPGNYTISLTKSGYYNGGINEVITGAVQKKYYMLAIPVTTTSTINPTATITSLPYTTLPPINTSFCRNSIDVNNESFVSPFLNIEACVGIVTPIYQNYILATLITVILAIILGKKNKTLESFLIGAVIGLLISVFTQLISWPIFIMVMLAMAFIYTMGKEGGKK
jgi:PKD repeat protein